MAEKAGKSEGGKLSKDDLEDLETEQVRTGKAPIAPGPEKPVDEELAAKAKQNRGRGLG